MCVCVCVDSYQSDSLDHVCDVGAHGTDSGDFLLDAKPLLYKDRILGLHLDVNSHMTEVPLQSTTWSLHCDGTGLDTEGH